MSARKTSGWGRTKPPAGASIDWGDPISSGLVGRWLFTEVRARISDLTGRNLLRGYSGVTETPGPFGGNALLFDGVTGKCRSEFQGARPVITTRPMTFVAWMRQTDSAASCFGVSVQDEATATSYYVIFIVGTTGKFRAQQASPVNTVIAESTLVALPDRWYQVVGVWGAEATDRRIYVNGRLEGSESSSISTDPALIDTLTIGALNRSTPAYGKGGVDNVSVYNRALSPTEILRLYNEPFAGIVAPRRRISNTPPAAANNANGRMFLTFP